MNFKNQLFFTIIFTCLFVKVYSQQKTKFSSEEDKNLNIELNGQIKSIKIENITNGDSQSYVYYFNKIGLPTKISKIGLGVYVMNRKLRNEEVIFEFTNGKLISKLNKMTTGLDGDVYKYDKNWNRVLEKNYVNNILVKEISQKFNDENKIIEKTEYLYGGFNSYDEKSESGKDSYLLEKEEYKYDKNNNITIKSKKNFRQDFSEDSIYKYDSSNNLIEEGQCFKSKGKSDCNYKPLFGYEYNKKKQLIKEFQLAKFSPHNTVQYYKYDKSGNKIESLGKYIYPDNKTEIGYQFKYEYNEYGNKVKDTEVIGKYRMLNFDKYNIEITKYDKHQNVILEEFITEENKPVKVIVKTYKYDENKNWTGRITQEGKSYDELKTIEVAKRKIEYY